jgi:NADPH:quinone reductase-like Zn-dependent oxidoreductase
MRAVVIHAHGGPDALTFEPAWPRPEPGPEDILVSVRACGLNHLDIFARDGMPREPTPLPLITGGDVAGVVHAAGSKVSWPRAGDRILVNPLRGCGTCEYCRRGEAPRCLRYRMLGEHEPGGLAEFVTCRAAQAVPLPPDYPFARAACLPITFGTAWRMLTRYAAIRPGDAVVVLGAGGGVAIAAIQIARLMGATVIATASSEEKLERARRLGATHTINYAIDEAWDVAVRRLTGKRGADVIVESVGSTTWERSIRALGRGGRLVTCGATAGPIGATDIRYVFRREQTLQGSNGWTHDELLRVADLAFRGVVEPVIDRILPLERTVDGERAMENREVFGKVIIDPTLRA